MRARLLLSSPPSGVEFGNWSASKLSSTELSLPDPQSDTGQSTRLTDVRSATTGLECEADCATLTDTLSLASQCETNLQDRFLDIAGLPVAKQLV